MYPNNSIVISDKNIAQVEHYVGQKSKVQQIELVYVYIRADNTTIL